MKGRLKTCILVLAALAVPAMVAAADTLALPFTLAADGLRALSLSGGAGNAAAIVLYAVLCLSPLLLVRRRKEDALLFLCSGTMFYVMYVLINPGLMPGVIRNEVGELICAGTVYSILICWGVLRLLKAGDDLGVEGTYQALRMFLLICAVQLAMLGIIGGFNNLMQDIAEIRSGNTMPGQNLTLTYGFAALEYAAYALEYVLDAVVMWLAAELLKELEAAPYSEACAAAGDRLARGCRRSLCVITVSATVLNLGQLVCASWLHHISGSVRIPVFSLALVFATLALTQLLNQGKELKDENDMFV